MLLAGLRRCEMQGLRFEYVQVADRRLAAAEGKRLPLPDRPGGEPGSPARSAATCTSSLRGRTRTGCW